MLVFCTKQEGHMDLSDDRVGLITHEIGAAVIELTVKGEFVCRQTIIDLLETRRKEAGNTIRKGVLRDAAKILRREKAARCGQS
ncbi:hypothetical protein [Xenorhabdus bovienii]|uniref:hypothetical protein n=1 Tax=Xenorhabdus bovienii TaxID=40576 RepID=UPI0023B32F3F|nr:hypothetical protein [Xenorhabdus bovienii]